MSSQDLALIEDYLQYKEEWGMAWNRTLNEVKITVHVSYSKISKFRVLFRLKEENQCYGILGENFNVEVMEGSDYTP